MSAQFPVAAYLLSSGLMTSLGQDLNDIQVAMQAGMSRFETSDILDRYGEGITLATVPERALASTINEDKLEGELNPRQRRLLRLSIKAIQSLLEQVGVDKLTTSLPLFLAGPDIYPDVIGEENSALLGRHFIRNLAIQTKINIDLVKSRVHNVGRPGVLGMLDIASQYFAADQGLYALVGGVDSHYHVATLDYLENQQRLLSESNSDGFIPGEGAGFFLVLSPKAPDHLKEQAIAVMSKPTFKKEVGHLLNDEHAYKAGTLSQVIDQLRQQQTINPQQLFSSANGEGHYHKELTIARIRQKSYFNQSKTIRYLAETIGDTGAAYGAIAVALAAHSNYRSTGVLASGDSGWRAGFNIKRYV